jgi:choline dehydrogenase-like flavoprotein
VNKQVDRKDFDAIIVGSGPGGATVAREFSKQKKRVLILERGGNAPLKEGLLAAASILNAVSVSDRLAAASAFTTGGTTAIYFAVADVPPLDTFLSLGIDISMELDEARRELPLAILPDELLGAQAMRVRESAVALGYPWKKNTMLVDLSKCASGYAYEAKWNARRYLGDAVEAGATLVTRARVIKVLVEKDRAIGVEYKLHRTKKEFEVRQAYGTKIILASGGAASPIILRASGIRNVANRGFYCHPGFGVFGTVSGLKAGETFVGSMGMDVKDGVGVADANFARTMYRLFMLSQRRVIRAFRHSKSIGVGVMVKDRLGGGLREDGRYHKELTKEDRGKLKDGERIARQIIQNAGGKHVFTSSLGAAHVGGAIRITEHVDADLQTEYTNLYVCDGSVIPENVDVTPTLTLICLGKYLVNQLSRTS